MKIKQLIEQLTELQQKGVKVIDIVDSNWNDYELEGIEQSGTPEIATMMVSFCEEEEE
jgi:hypothetical protein